MYAIQHLYIYFSPKHRPMSLFSTQLKLSEKVYKDTMQ